MNYFRSFILWHISFIGLFLLLPFIPVLRSSVHAAVLINEVLPKTDDNANEFIELYNNGADPVVLDRWTLENTNGDKKSYIFNASAKIDSKTFLTIYQSQSGINLSNAGDTVKLTDDKSNPVDSQSYISTIGWNTSMGRNIDGAGSWAICNTPATPNQPNNCPAPTPLPTALPTAIPTDTPTPEPTATLEPSPTDVPPTVFPTSQPTLIVTPAVLGTAAVASTSGTWFDQHKSLGILMIIVSIIWVGLIGFYAITHRKKTN